MLKDFDLQSIDGLDLKKAIIVETNFKLNQFRTDYDIILPEISHQFYRADKAVDDSDSGVQLCPARRKYLATFLGPIDGRHSIHNTIRQTLLKLSSQTSNNNELLFDFVCDDKTKRLCDNQTLILRQSTFALILPPIDNQLIFSSELSKRLIDVLISGMTQEMLI